MNLYFHVFIVFWLGYTTKKDNLLIISIGYGYSYVTK
jgi:hypothetical protein